MTLQRSILILIVSAFLHGIARAEPPQSKPAPAPTPETAWARRAIYVPDAPDFAIVGDMVSDAVVKNCQLLGVSAADVGELMNFEPRGDEKKSTQFQITVFPSRRKDAKLRAVEFLDAVTSTLEDRLKAWNGDMSARDRAAHFADETERDWQSARRKLEDAENQIRSATGRVDASLDAVRLTASRLEEERESLKLQLVGKQARQKSLAETIEEFAKRAEVRAKDDPVAAELAKVVEARTAAMVNVHELHKTGAVSQQDLRESEAAVAEARARMLERRDAVTRANGGDLLSSLNRELASLSIDLAEVEAKLTAVEEARVRYMKAQPAISRIEELRPQRDRTWRDMVAAATSVREVEMRVNRPLLRVIRTESMAPDDPRVKNMLKQEEEDRQSAKRHYVPQTQP